MKKQEMKEILYNMEKDAEKQYELNKEYWLTLTSPEHVASSIADSSSYVKMEVSYEKLLTIQEIAYRLGLKTFNNILH